MDGQTPCVRSVSLIVGDLFGLGVGQKDGSLAEGKKSGGQIGGGNGDGVSMVAEGTVVQFCELANTTLDAGTDGGGPEHTVLAELEVARAPFR